MNKDTVIAAHCEHIAEDMFQHMCAYAGANLRQLGGKDENYSLRSAYAEIQDGITLPEGCSFKFLGYELFLETPLTFFIKFGLGQFWIGARHIVLRFKEEVVGFFRHLITDLLPAAMEEYRSILYKVNKDLLKADKLRSLLEGNADAMIRAALKGTRMKFTLTFHTYSATLKLWRRKSETTVSTLHYETFEEDLNKAIQQQTLIWNKIVH